MTYASLQSIENKVNPFLTVNQFRTAFRKAADNLTAVKPELQMGVVNELEYIVSYLAEKSRRMKTVRSRNHAKAVYKAATLELDTIIAEVAARQEPVNA